MSGIKVTVASPQVVLTSGLGTVAVTVTNAQPLKDRIVLSSLTAAHSTALPAPPTCATVERPQREIAAGATEQYAVAVDATPLTEGTYALRMAAYSADKAPEDFSDANCMVTFVVEPPPPPPPPGRKVKWWWIVAAAGLLAIVAGVLWFLLRSSGVVVPDLEGKTAAQATSTLERAGLEIEVTEGPGPAPVGEVASQNPPARSEVGAGSTVTVVIINVSQVPDLLGLSEAAASERLTALGAAPTALGCFVTEAVSCRVDALEPPAGTPITPGIPVVITMVEGEPDPP